MKTNDLARTVKDTISKHTMFASGDVVLVAVSGGPDSVAMLSVLAEAASEFEISLHVFHLNHMLRETATEDAHFVEELAARMNLPATIEAFDVAAYCEEQKCGVETGAREVRYRLMDEVADRIGATKIATGHTLDDQVETSLMRLVRGAGATGLRGIPAVRGRYVRPLIGATRAQVVEWCENHGLSYRLDETNAVSDQLRNLVRLQILPVLEKANPNIRETILRAMELLTEDDEFLSELAADTLRQLERQSATGRIRMDLDAFTALPAALSNRVIRATVDKLGGDASDLTKDQLDEVRRQLDGNTPVEVHLTGGLRLWTEYGDIIVARESAEPPDVERTLAIPGTTEVPELGIAITARFVDRNDLADTPSGDGSAAVDAAAVADRLTVTGPRSGDRFRPFGMAGTKKLSDLFVDGKVPKRDRGKVPVVRSGEAIVWVVGHRIDDRFRIDERTERVLILEVVAR